MGRDGGGGGAGAGRGGADLGLYGVSMGEPTPARASMSIRVRRVHRVEEVNCHGCELDHAWGVRYERGAVVCAPFLHCRKPHEHSDGHGRWSRPVGINDVVHNTSGSVYEAGFLPAIPGADDSGAFGQIQNRLQVAFDFRCFYKASLRRARVRSFDAHDGGFGSFGRSDEGVEVAVILDVVRRAQPNGVLWKPASGDDVVVVLFQVEVVGLIHFAVHDP